MTRNNRVTRRRCRPTQVVYGYGKNRTRKKKHDVSEILRVLYHVEQVAVDGKPNNNNPSSRWVSPCTHPREELASLNRFCNCLRVWYILFIFSPKKLPSVVHTCIHIYLRARVRDPETTSTRCRFQC